MSRCPPLSAAAGIQRIYPPPLSHAHCHPITPSSCNLCFLLSPHSLWCCSLVALVLTGAACPVQRHSASRRGGPSSHRPERSGQGGDWHGQCRCHHDRPETRLRRQVRSYNLADTSYNPPDLQVPSLISPDGPRNTSTTTNPLYHHTSHVFLRDSAGPCHTLSLPSHPLLFVWRTGRRASCWPCVS